jgi:uncharacterized RDD family membrane protein YckC
MTKKRISAFIIDYGIGSVGTIILSIGDIYILMTEQNYITPVFFLIYNIILLTAVLYFLFRDVFGKRSIGKRIMKLKIIDRSNLDTPNAVRRIVRNITILLMWPVEFILFLRGKERLGDRLAKTTVVEE